MVATLGHPVERYVAKLAIDSLLENGYSLHIDKDDRNEENDVPINNSNENSLDELFATGVDVLHVVKDKYRGFVLFVAGNEPHYVIADYSSSLENILKPTQDFADLCDEVRYEECTDNWEPLLKLIPKE
jgi:hypothetical protein